MVLVEELTPEKNIKQRPSAEASTRKSKFRHENPEEFTPKIKIEIDSSNTHNCPNKGVSSISVVVNFLSTPYSQEVKVSFL
jgi:hypothetical protein